MGGTFQPSAWIHGPVSLFIHVHRFNLWDPSFYAAALICYVILYLLAGKTHNRPAALIGTVWTAVSSYCFMQYGWTQDWEWYFKPFTATQLLIALSAAALFIQLLAIRAAEKNKL